MSRKRLVVRILLALGVTFGAAALSATPATAEEACLDVHQDGVGTYVICHPMP